MSSSKVGVYLCKLVYRDKDCTGMVEAYSEKQAMYRFCRQCGLSAEDDVLLQVNRVRDAEEAMLYPRDFDEH